jgi:hypothetical protein
MAHIVNAPSGEIGIRKNGEVLSPNPFGSPNCLI